MTLRIGFIGVGGIAQVHLENVKGAEDVKITAVCDIDQNAVNRVASKYDAVGYTDSTLMLNEEKLDAVFVCVPPFAHGEIEEVAAARGIHLFVEKPLGLSMETVLRKAEILRSSGIIIGTGYCLRYLDTVQQAKQFLKDREVAMVNGYYYTSFVGTPWWRVMAKSGGQLVEQTTHTVDLVRYLGGEVSAVHAFMGLKVSKEIENLDIYDIGSVNVSFTSGAVGHVGTNFIQKDHRSGVEIMGKDFRLQIDGTTLIITEPDKTTTVKSKVDFYKEQDLAFLEAVRREDRTKILASYDDALKTLAVTLAANESAKTGQAVSLAIPAEYRAAL